MIRALSKSIQQQQQRSIGTTTVGVRSLSSLGTTVLTRNNIFRHKPLTVTTAKPPPNTFRTNYYYYYYYYHHNSNDRQSTAASAAIQSSRSFFSSGSTDGTSGGNNNNDSKNDNDNDDDKNDKGNDDVFDDSDKTKKVDDDDADTSSSSSSDSKNRKSEAVVVITPSKLPFGESAPRLPHMIALPLVSRPLFPGLITSVTITDPATINAVEELHTKGNSFLSCFLRAKYSSGVISETGTVLKTPELITDLSDLHRVGTFAQIQRFTRDVQRPKPTDLSTSDSDDDSDDNTNDDRNNSSGSTSAATLILLAHRRVDLASVDSVGPPIDVTVKHWPRMEYTPTASDDSIRALSNEIISTIREVAQMNLLFRENLQLFPMKFDANDPFRLADFAASISASGSPEDLQEVLAERNPEVRLHKALVLLIREREVSKLQKEISQKVDEKMSEAQRKYFLTEQLRSIKKELGMERDDKDALIEKYRTTLKSYPQPIPTEAAEVIEAEIDKFATLEKNSAEYNVTRSYLDWLIAIPWNVTTTENFNISTARATLDHDHYGMEDVKTTILQFIAVGKLKQQQQQKFLLEKQQKQQEQQQNSTSTSGTSTTATDASNNVASSSIAGSPGKILCLAGPPGTGKTSIANSIANALGRKFYRFSVGGLSDVSEIKGHRRTYVGAMPGKIIQCLKTTGTFNAVCLIDEIDKLGMGYRGDPASALLEVLDPSQNSTFRDHFIDVPVDISKILFICTANEVERIPGPLLDRMEVIRLSGYDFPEKVTIAEQYLVPKSMRDSGLMMDPASSYINNEPDTTSDPSNDSANAPDSTTKEPTPFDQYVPAEGVPSSLSITTEAITSLVRWYAREAGVRNLAKYIDKITRKLALQVVAEAEGTVLTEKAKRKTDSWIIDDNNLSEYVGKPRFTSDRLYETGPLPSGIVMGLAYTSMGGTALYIETQGIKRGVDENGKPRGGGSLKATGQLGDVMQESAQIAYTVARARLGVLQPDNSIFDTTDIHMHVPEGATPKDGPSAGITMVTSMLSLAMDRPIRNDVAMTGEISLTGKVLPVGGIKEKIMAARRAGISHVVLPESNRRDYDEIPEYLKDGLTVHYADHYDKVFEVVFD